MVAPLLVVPLLMVLLLAVTLLLVPLLLVVPVPLVLLPVLPLLMPPPVPLLPVPLLPVPLLPVPLLPPPLPPGWVGTTKAVGAGEEDTGPAAVAVPLATIMLTANTAVIRVFPVFILDSRPRCRGEHRPGAARSGHGRQFGCILNRGGVGQSVPALRPR
ncbi:MAG: hypothetical protein DLM60_19975 [Pseudonocardiales bacterium]|nr:MAG: hypothetical protein DLM60_19975 [Pseudonocardiales bacterium]